MPGDREWRRGFFFIVKGNQRNLRDDIEMVFTDPQAVCDETVEVDKHGDRVEVRRLQSSTALNEYLDWPHLKQVCRIEREVTRRGQTTRETAFAITSLSAEQHDAADLLAINRGHWGIENRLHYVRDVTLGEDACRVRTGMAPQVLAA